MPAPTKPERFTYIDWLRGFACLLMFQVHAYDSWLSPSARETKFFNWSQLSGTVPAPLFLFLAGVSFALVTDKMRRKGVPANEIARKTILRGAEILALGYGFRLQEYLLGLPWAPWTDLLRVDILNTIGFSMILMGVVCWFARRSTPRGGRAGCPGFWSPTSTACTRSKLRSHGSSRLFRGRRLRLPA